jgi:hypothetical protein
MKKFASHLNLKTISKISVFFKWFRIEWLQWFHFFKDSKDPNTNVTSCSSLTNLWVSFLLSVFDLVENTEASEILYFQFSSVPSLSFSFFLSFFLSFFFLSSFCFCFSWFSPFPSFLVVDRIWGSGLENSSVWAIFVGEKWDRALSCTL